ncbi:MAG: aldo/keto reductase [Acidobacteria bacterium]|nr:aldo/keto reductase [Acidobacteriota bacterium]
MIPRRSLLAAALALPAPAQTAVSGAIPTRRLGATNENVSILAMGGAHLGRVGAKEQAAATRMVRTAVDAGLTFMDNAWDYLNGEAETVMGHALRDGYRAKVFLMSKNCGRDYKTSMANLDESLRRLQTDRLDLWQFHEINYDNDPDWVVERGPLKAALEAKKAGKIRHIGFTGHKDPSIHLKMLGKNVTWTTAQMPINPLDAFYRSFQNEVLPVCVKKGVSVIGMKCLGGGPYVARIPSQTKLTAEQCVRYSLSLPITTLCRGYTTMEQLLADLAIAKDFQPLSRAAKEEILALARPEAGDGRHELFKSTQFFDGPTHRSQHGFDTTVPTASTTR